MYIFGRARFVFHLGLAVLAFGSFLFVPHFLVCVCAFCFYFADVFSSTLCGRISGLRFPRDPVLYNPLRVLFRMLRWLAEHPVPPPSNFLPATDGGLGHENMA